MGGRVGVDSEHGGMLSVTDDEALGGARFELWLPVDNDWNVSHG